MEGFIKLNRKLLDWEWYKDTNTKALWLHILLSVNWEDKRWQGIEVPKGSMITSISHLAHECGLSVKNVRTSLKKLETTNEVAIKTANKYTHIFVNKWAFYQLMLDESGKQSGEQTGKQVANKWQTSGKQVATTKEYKEIKEYKERNNKEYYRHNEIPIYDSSSNRQMTEEEMSELLECVGKA